MTYCIGHFVVENYHLESLFAKWLYNKGKNNSIVLKDWSVSKIRNLYNTFIENYVIKEESVYDSDEEEYRNELKEKVIKKAFEIFG